MVGGIVGGLGGLLFGIGGGYYYYTRRKALASLVVPKEDPAMA